MKTTGISLILVAMLASCTSPQIDIITTTKQEPWQISHHVKFNPSDEGASVVIDRTKTDQTIEGFGGCFNELGWVALSKLSDVDRENIMSELFSPQLGANFTICRMPVAANDFSLDWYSYNEVEDDFAMENFSIENDKTTLIPYINAAKQYAPELKIWASPWSPPSWMKYNEHYACATAWDGLDPKYHNGLAFDNQGKEGSNMFIQEEAYFESYALYFSKFIEAYRENDINISMIMPQNEFNSCQIFPSCTWTSAGLSEFIGLHLGPAMEKQNVEIMFGTMERPTEALVDSVINDSEAGKYINGVGFQWAGKEAIPGIHKRYPNLKLYQTEQECGDGKNDWEHCLHSWDLMKHYISNGASSYLYWNIALEEGGISRWGWSQNSLITVNGEEGSFRYNHEYYLLKHVSHFVQPGAKVLKTEGEFTNLLVFENPDKSLIIVIQNEEDENRSITFNIDGKDVRFLLKADSFNTISIN
ncbi:MAG: glycoside hydrolase family 30 beta sandwich domain-containing protein [Prolixibacteraceae bacterium]